MLTADGAPAASKKRLKVTRNTSVTLQAKIYGQEQPGNRMVNMKMVQTRKSEVGPCLAARSGFELLRLESRSLVPTKSEILRPVNGEGFAFSWLVVSARRIWKGSHARCSETCPSSADPALVHFCSSPIAIRFRQTIRGATQCCTQHRMSAQYNRTQFHIITRCGQCRHGTGSIRRRHPRKSRPKLILRPQSLSS